MKIRSLLVFICSIVIIFQINAQTVSDYFHKSAKFYIDGEKSNAKKTIQEAIQKYPNDPKLKQLASAIDKLPDDKNDQNSKNNKNKNEDKENKDKQKQDQQNQDKKDQQQKQDQNDKQQKQGQQSQMSKENAQQILDALMQDEKNTQDKAKKQQVKATKKADKDW